MREFESGAIRNESEGKLCYDGFFNPLVLKKRAEYMHKHRKMETGELRDPDNWQKGIPADSAIESLARHYQDVHLWHRGYTNEMVEPIEDALCAVMFNCESLLLTLLEERRKKSRKGK